MSRVARSVALGSLVAVIAAAIFARPLWWPRDESKVLAAPATEAPSSRDPAESEVAPVDAVVARELQIAPLDSSSTESALAQADAPRVVVTVLDAERRPIADALVEITDEAPLGSWRTGADGRCELPLEPGPEAVVLRISAEGYVSDCGWESRDPELGFTLYHPVRVSGRIVSSDRREGVPGAEIQVFAMIGCRSDEPDAVTDETGRFELSSVPPTEDTAWTITAEGFFPLEQALALLEDKYDVEVALERGIPLVLQVEDAQSGAPIEGATISGGRKWVETDAQGRAASSELASVVEGADLGVSAPGYCRLRAKIGATELGPGSTVRLALLRGIRLEGRVLGAGGEPEAARTVYLSRRRSTHREDGEQGARAWLQLPEGWAMDWSSKNKTESELDGRFAFDGLAPGEGSYCAMVADDLGRMFEWVSVPRTGPPGSTTTMELSLAAPLTGIVTGGITFNGSPARGQVHWRGPSRWSTQQLNEDGTFRCEDVEPGTIAFLPWPEGLVSATCEGVFEELRSLEVEAGAEARIDIDLALEMATISGRVVDRNGVPRAGLSVRGYSGEGCWSDDDATQPDGTFELLVRAGPWSYQLAVGEYPDSAELDGVTAGARDLELALAGSGTLRLRVLDSKTREPLRDIYWFLENESGEVFAMYELSEETLDPDPLGWFQQDLRPGLWRVLVADTFGSLSGYLPADGGTVLVQHDSAPAVVEILRERGLELEVRLAQDQASWPEDVLVLLLEVDHADQVVLGEDGTVETGGAYDGIALLEARRIQPDARGRARAVSLWGGPCRFVAFPDTIAIEPAEVVVTGTETGPLEIRWKPR
jgi:hypothetical protein